MGSEVRNAISQAIGDLRYLKLDCTNDPLTGNLEIETTAPSLTLTDSEVGDDDYSIAVDGDNLVITNLDTLTDGFIDLDHLIRIRNNVFQPLPSFVGSGAIFHQPTFNITGGAVQGYFLIQDNPTIQIGGAYNSYGIISAQGTVTCTTTNALEAVYLFVNVMNNTATTGNFPASIHSFESKPRVFASTGVITGACPEIAGFNDWTNVESIGTGQVTLTNWITVNAKQFNPFYYRIQTDNVAGSVVVVNRIGLEMEEVTKAGGGGTETIQNYYGFRFLGFTNATQVACGGWIVKNSGAVANYGLVLDGDGIGADLVLGDGQDVKMYYDGTVLYLDASIVAPSDFEIDCGTQKTLELVETVWEDLRTPFNAVKLAGVKDPTFTTFQNGTYAYNFADQALAINEEEVFFTIQLSHSYKEGTDVYPHIHWTPSDGNAGVVRWGLEYTWVNQDGIFGATTTIYIDDSTDSTDRKHLRADIGAITGTGKTISSMLVCRLFRNSSHANDTYTSGAFLLEIDFHFEVNTMGSRQELVK